MNGQTGKFVGEMPMDKKAYRKWQLIYTLIFTVVSFLMLLLISGFVEDFSALSPIGVIASVVLGFIISFAPMSALKKEINNVEFNKTAYNYMSDNAMELSLKQDRLVDRQVTRQAVQRNDFRQKNGFQGSQGPSGGRGGPVPPGRQGGRRR